MIIEKNSSVAELGLWEMCAAQLCEAAMCMICG